MPLDFRGILNEVYRRGSDYLDDSADGEARVKRWVNDAMHQVNGQCAWPFLEAVATGAAPLTITDLGSIESVVDSDRGVQLVQRSRAELTGSDPAGSATGQPFWYVVTGGDTITSWPSSAANLLVRYRRVAPDLVADTDVPAMPDRFRSCLVELAVAAMLRDDQSPDWTIAQQTGMDIVGLMREWALELEPAFTVVAPSGDDL